MNADLAGARAPFDTPVPPVADDVAALPTSGRGSRRTALRVAVALVVVAALPVGALAQSGAADPRTMTVEELERHVERQKAALERVRENRDITVEKAREVREALAEREAKRAEAEAELETLCRERDELEPGSYDACAAQIRGD